MLEPLILKRIQSHTTSFSNFNQPTGATFQLPCYLPSIIYITLLIQAHPLYSYHWTLVPPLTLLNNLSSSIDYKRALVLLASLLHGSNLTSLTAADLFALAASNLQKLHAARVFHMGLCLVPCFSLYTSHLSLTLSAHSVYCSSGMPTTHNFTTLCLKTITFLPQTSLSPA